MNLQQLEYLAETCRCGSVSAAALECSITQQAVSAAIKALERELGVKLFLRTTSGSLPTPACLEIIDKVRDVLADCREIRAITSMRAKAPGDVRLALTRNSIDPRSPGPHLEDIDRFVKAHPCMDVQRVVTSGDACLAMVEHGMADLAIVIGLPDPDKYESVILSADEMALVVREDSPLARYGGPVSFAELRGIPIIPPSELGFSLDSVSTRCRYWGFEPLFDMEPLVDGDMLKTIAERGCVALAPLNFTVRNTELGKEHGLHTKLVRFMAEERYDIELRLAWLKGVELGSSAALMRSFLCGFVTA